MFFFYKSSFSSNRKKSLTGTRSLCFQSVRLIHFFKKNINARKKGAKNTTCFNRTLLLFGLKKNSVDSLTDPQGEMEECVEILRNEYSI